MATIRKRQTKEGATRWQAIVRVKGTRLVTQTFGNPQSARSWAKRTEDGLKHGRLADRLEASRHTLRDAIREYEASSSWSELKETTRSCRIYELRWWRSRLGYVTLDQLTPQLIRAEIETLEVSGSAKNRRRSALSAVLGCAHLDLGWIAENPCQKVRSWAENDARDRWLTKEEAGRLVDACSGELRVLVVLALTTAARQRELLGLMWSDVSRWIDADGIECGTITLRDTKNGMTRSCILHEPALVEVSELAGVRQIGGRVFSSTTFPRMAWERALRDAEIDPPITFHGLRHTAMTWMALSGATLAELAAFGGYKDLSQVKRYTHLTAEHTVERSRTMVESFLHA